MKVEDPLGENIDANRHKSAPHEIQYSALSVCVCVCVFFGRGGFSFQPAADELIRSLMAFSHRAFVIKLI